MEEPEPTGVITGIVTYSGDWPSPDSLKDLRFVPLTFIPETPEDIFSEFSNLVFSEQLDFNTERDTFIVENVPNGKYIYNTIAQQFGQVTDWRPVGLYKENGGIIIIDDDTVSITIHVDFENLPPFSIE